LTIALRVAQRRALPHPPRFANLAHRARHPKPRAFVHSTAQIGRTPSHWRSHLRGHLQQRPQQGVNAPQGSATTRPDGTLAAAQPYFARSSRAIQPRCLRGHAATWQLLDDLASIFEEARLRGDRLSLRPCVLRITYCRDPVGVIGAPLPVNRPRKPLGLGGKASSPPPLALRLGRPLLGGPQHLTAPAMRF
jgi:hypothetical protein